jgi:hypothetical protein
LPAWLDRGFGPPAPPDFIGVGTHLSGSLWWRGLLGQHPQIRPPRDAWDAEIAEYHAIFRRREGEIAGEWSDRYSFHVWTAPLLKRAAPDAKLLVMLRDPVERYRRNLSMQLASDRETALPVQMAEAFSRSRYGAQVRALINVFGSERVLVLQQEACRLEPHHEYVRTLRFLGVDDRFVPRGLNAEEREFEDVPHPWLRRLRGKRVPVPVDLWPDIETALVRDLRDDMAALADLAPAIDLDLWPPFAAAPSTRARAADLPKPSRMSRRLIAGVVAGVAAVAGVGIAFTDLL